MKSRCSALHIFSILLALSILALPAFCQTITTADAVGTVTDTSGAIVPGATVTVKSVGSGETRTVTANDQGQYRFPLMNPGEYLLTASSKGLKSNTTRITLLVGQEQTVNLAMSPEGTTTLIEVTAEAPILQTENANLETSFNSKQVEALPMPGGDLTTLAMTTPGVRVAVTGGTGNMQANGIPGVSILFTLNGSDQMDPANNYNNSGASNNLLGANEVSEAAVVVNAYSPQYGRMAGGQVNLVGFAGGNSFHGNLFHDYNWQGLNANDFFSNATGTPRGRSDAHQFGGRIGGPIKKNKLFFFFDDENLRYVLPSAGTVSLPSPQLQAYALAHVPAASLPLYQDMFSLLKSSPGIGRAVPVTNGNGNLQDGNGVLGCGTGTFVGTPDGAGGKFGVTTPCAVAFGTNNTQLNTEGLYTIRVDYNVTNSQKLFFRYNHDFGIQATGTSPVSPAFNAVSNQPQWTGSVNYTAVITPNLVNNFIGSAFYYSALFGVVDFAKTSALMPEAINLTDGGANGGGFVTVGGGTYPNGVPAGRNVGHAQLIDDLSWTHGRHTIKGGISFRYDRYNYSSIAQSAFVGQYNLADVADFANGTLNFGKANLGSSFSQAYTPYGALHFRVPSADFYVSDEWAVASNLKLTFGMRFEKDFNPSCVETCFVLLNVPFVSPSYQGGASIPYNSSIATRKNTFYNVESIIPQPRVGIAWKPFNDNKTVIRAGIGLFSTNFTDGLAGTFAAQIPNRFTPSGLNFGNVGLASDPASSASSAASSASAFFSGFSKGFTLAQLRAAVAPASFSTPSFSSLPDTYRQPKDIEWSFEIQRELNTHNLFSILYVGNHGYNLQETVNANMFTGAAGVTRYGGGFAGLPTAAPDSRFVSVTQYYNNGVSNYDGLTVQFRHTFSYGLTGQIHYTWSHTLGTVAYENPFNVHTGYGSLNFDNRHQAAADFVWTQPHKFENHWVNVLASGYTVSGKLFAYSGAPFSVTDSKIPAQVNSAGGVLTPLADLLTGSAVSSDCGKVAVNTACLSRTQFATYSTASGAGTPVQTDWGNIAPDSFRGPGYFDIDAQISRAFRIKEKMTFSVGINTYNLLNHPNFNNPSGSLSSGSFGKITSVVGPPTSIYGSFQGASVSGRVGVLTARFTF
jgi:hypothetical protein